MEPAYHIPLEPEQLRTLGEICAIQGQIEYLLQHATQRLLKLSHAEMLAKLKSDRLTDNAKIFLDAAHQNCSKADLIELAERVHSQIELLAADRKDFLHAIFADAPSGGGFTLASGIGIPIVTNPTAVRTKNRAMRPASELIQVRDQAAWISCALAHFEFCLGMGEGATYSTGWKDRVYPLP
jgi:hypothetical protein